MVVGLLVAVTVPMKRDSALVSERMIMGELLMLMTP